MNNVSFSILSGGLGRPLSGEDHFTGLVTYIANADIPAGFTTTDRIKVIYSPNDATALGIVSTSAINAVKVLRYQIDELFRINKKAIVYVGIYDSASIDYSVIETVQNFADGKIRQFGVITAATAFNSTTVTALNTSCENMFNVHKPAIAILGCDTSSVALSALVDLRALSKKNVSVVIGQDGAATGAALAVSTTKSVANVGAVLGAISLSKVHENVGWISKFNLVNSEELDVPAFGNAALVKNQTESLLNAIDAKGWIFFRKHIGIAGTYINDSHTATSASDDFAFIENNRTIQKAIRGIRTYLLPDLSSPLYLNPNGTMTDETVAHLTNSADRFLDQMLTDGEISAKLVEISPVQNVASTSTVNIGISIVPVGVARQISVNIGFVANIQS